MEIFAQRLKEERINCGLTQQKIAEKLGIPLDTYRSYESRGAIRHRNPDYDMLVKIARTLDTTIDYLLGKDEI